MRSIEVKIRQLFWAIEKLRYPTNNDLVIYQGDRYWIKSSLTGENKWNLFQKEIKEPMFCNIHGTKLKIVGSFKRYLEVFKQNLQFQKQCWEMIDCQNPIGTRLSYINSENILFYRTIETL